MKKKIIFAIIIFLVIVFIFGVVELKHEELKSEVVSTSREVINEDKLSNKEKNDLALEVLKNYCKVSGYEDMNGGGMPNILEALGFMTRDEIWEFLQSNSPYEGDYYKTEIKYEDFKDKMLAIFTEEYFENNFKKYKNIDGYVGIINVGVGMVPVDIDSIISCDYTEDGKYLCKAKVIDVELLNHVKSGEETEMKEEDCYFESEVELQNVGGKLLINRFIYDEE